MPVDLSGWCRRRVTAFWDWEQREMAMFPTRFDRDVAIVEWTLRTLGNPELPESADVVRQLAERHAPVVAP